MKNLFATKLSEFWISIRTILDRFAQFLDEDAVGDEPAYLPVRVERDDETRRARNSQGDLFQ